MNAGLRASMPKHALIPTGRTGVRKGVVPAGVSLDALFDVAVSGAHGMRGAGLGLGGDVSGPDLDAVAVGIFHVGRAHARRLGVVTEVDLVDVHAVSADLRDA